MLQIDFSMLWTWLKDWTWQGGLLILAVIAYQAVIVPLNGWATMKGLNLGWRALKATGRGIRWACCPSYRVKPQEIGWFCADLIDALDIPGETVWFAEESKLVCGGMEVKIDKGVIQSATCSDQNVLKCLTPDETRVFYDKVYAVVKDREAALVHQAKRVMLSKIPGRKDLSMEAHQFGQPKAVPVNRLPTPFQAGNSLANSSKK